MANYRIKENTIIADIPNLTSIEIQEVRNYMALGFTLKVKTKSISIVEMRAALEKAPDTLKDFDNALADKKTKDAAGNTLSFKDTGFGKACKIYNDWKKENKKENK